MAEGARMVTVKRMQEENLASEGQAGAERQARRQGEGAAAQIETGRIGREAEAARASSVSEAQRVKRETDAQRAAAQADIERATREKGQAEAARAAAVL